MPFVAGVVGSDGYNVTMSLGMGALIDPITIFGSRLIGFRCLAMVALIPTLSSRLRGSWASSPWGGRRPVVM